MRDTIASLLLFSSFDPQNSSLKVVRSDSLVLYQVSNIPIHRYLAKTEFRWSVIVHRLHVITPAWRIPFRDTSFHVTLEQTLDSLHRRHKEPTFYRQNRERRQNRSVGRSSHPCLVSRQPPCHTHKRCIRYHMLRLSFPILAMYPLSVISRE